MGPGAGRTRRRVEEEWIPRVERELRKHRWLRDYVASIRRELVPWKR